MCNLLLSVLFVVTLPPIWKGITKSLAKLWQGIGGILKWIGETTDSVARESVAEMLNHPTNPLSPPNAPFMYWVVRSISFLVMLYAIITALSILTAMGGL